MTSHAAAETFWNSLDRLAIKREADVEQRLLQPLLAALGYADDEITAKAPVVFQTGRKGRKHEADFIVHPGASLSLESSLLVVEAKAPTEDLEAGRHQAESYAHATRAPFLLLCDGTQFEIWQMQISQSSERAFVCGVHALRRHRGAIERLIARGSAVAHCRALGYKSLAADAGDVSTYVSHELARVAGASGIDRRLRTGGTDTAALPALERSDRGAFILAASGHGKTTLAHDLHHRSLARLADGDPVSFYLPLPDLAALDLSPEDYARERLAARCPHFASAAAFTDLLEARGARLICDGLDRIETRAQRTFLARVATLLRDRPKVQFHIFGRTPVSNSLPLPNFELMPLNSGEQLAIATRIDPWGGHAALQSFPTMLEPLLEHPLLLTLLLEHRQVSGALPSRLDDLFETWIRRLLEVDGHSPARVARLRDLLKRFAVAIGGASRARGPVLAATGIYDDVDLDALIATGALILGDQVELQHDALGDYLRAEALLDLTPNEVENRLPATVFLPGALFPALLMSRCRDLRVRNAIWTRIAETGLDVYLDVTRFGSDVDHFAAGAPDAVSTSYLSDLLRGIVEPMQWYLEQLAPELLLELADGPADVLGVHGRITEDRWVSYGFFPAKKDEPNLRLGEPKTRRRHGVRLNKVLGADNARALGFSKLRSALATVIRARCLKGGPLWWNERLLGRLRYAARSWKADIPLGSEFKALDRLLTPRQGQWVHFEGRDDGFSVSDMLDDIERLREHGWRAPDPWWERFGGEPLLHDADPARTAPLLDEYGRRCQRVLQELVDHSVPRLAQSLNFYQAMPVRYALHVEDLGNYRFAMMAHWFPVAGWNRAGADVEFGGERPELRDRERFAQIMVELGRFGRTGCKSVHFLSGVLPRFDGSHRNRRFDGETAVLRNALELFVQDLDGLFDRLPGTSIRSKALTGA
jgi:Type I restriction enzyme R protein N terminus (HSDR_N)